MSSPYDTNSLCLSFLGKLLNSSPHPPPSVCAEATCELTVSEADEGQDATGVAVFTVSAVWRAHLGKLTQEVLGGLGGFHHWCRRASRGRRGGQRR